MNDFELNRVKWARECLRKFMTGEGGRKMIDTEVLFVKWLDPEEKALWDEITGCGGRKDTMNMAESLQWLLLKEISQHRAAADGLHRRLASLRAVERKAEQEAFDRIAEEEDKL